jgi:Golgi apparatus protein 1
MQGSGHGKAAVLKCLVEKHDAISESQCASEISRATRMAIWQYRKGVALTQSCDADVDKFCSGISVSTVGAIGRCLAKQVTDNAALTENCKKMVMLAAPKDAKALFDGEMTTAAVVSKVEEIERKAGLMAAFIKNDNTSGSSMVTLTGWIALAAMAALIVVVISGVVFAYRKYTGQDKPYTLVVKGGDV